MNAEAVDTYTVSEIFFGRMQTTTDPIAYLGLILIREDSNGVSVEEKVYRFSLN